MRKREANICVQRAFVKFVEKNSAKVAEFSIARDEIGEHTLGDDFNLCLLANSRIEAGSYTHSVADMLAQHAGHTLSSAPRGDPTRLKHDDFLVAEPVRAKKM